MIKTQNFSEKIETDLKKLGQHIEEAKGGFEGETLSEKEILKKSVQSFSTQTPQGNTSGLSTSQSTPPAGHLPSYLKDADSKIKEEVENLIDIAFKTGLEKALREAKKHPPFIEDAFHDALVDKLLPELKKRKII